MGRRTAGQKLPPEAIAALKKGYQIQAIKIVCEKNGCGLKEAKEKVDRYVASDPVMQLLAERRRREGDRGCLVWAIAFGLGLTAMAYYLLTR